MFGLFKKKTEVEKLNEKYKIKAIRKKVPRH